MVEDAGDFAEESADPFCAFGDFNVEELFDGEGEALFVCHHGDVVEAVEVWESLQVGLVFNQLFGASVEEADVGICAYDLFTIELKN